ncbi:helix-turn-helix domain-containing protein [Anaerocolumna sedimenticola]|uniref:Helix-turn-helix domain-containing protein n=1 Tax=Anaerocolumna sedimenticola TaxID=2696063 RepID=A0A6P1TNC1_9FIRM|nr:AraC family transcriptional regulator [Anaerocolumna sedimenticola]QHQ61689.1 helix-turn-helix domain-containing protein [Anaerocolumna sedimenticola]
MKNNFSYEYIRDNFNQIACWSVDNNHYWPHFHSSIEIIYVTAGELKVTLNGQVYLVRQSNFLIIPSYYIHSYATDIFSSAYICIIPLDSIPSYKSTFSKKTFASLLVEKPPFEEELKHCLDSLCNIPKNIIHSALENILKGYIYVFLGLLINHVGLVDITDTKMISLAQEILIYLQDNYLKPLKLEEISEHFGYSRSRFSHIFNEFFDCKLVEYINGLRCRHALELLREKNTTITDIALASGFDSTRTFYRAFQKCFGCTPNESLTKL